MTALPPSPARAAGPAPGGGQVGFTLIEIMCAMVVFGIGMLALLACIPMTSRKVMSAGAQTRAASYAAEAAERLLTVPYGNSLLTPGTHDDPANPHDGLYYTRWVVEDNQPIASCKRITVLVARNTAASFPVARLVIVTPRAGG